MTYLEIVNAVLKRLREDTVTTIDETAQSTTIGEIVNTVKQEIEDAWEWNVLRDTIRVNTVADTFRYILTGAGTRSVITDVWNVTEEEKLYKASAKQLDNWLYTDDTNKDSPNFYGPNGADSSGDIQVDLFPIPDAVYALDFNMTLKQADLSSTSDVPLIPNNVLLLGAWALAVSERGEDGGASYAELDAKYQLALGNAIALDAANQHDSETIWTVQ